MIEWFSNCGAVAPQCAITADPRRPPATLRFGFAQKVFRLKCQRLPAGKTATRYVGHSRVTWLVTAHNPQEGSADFFIGILRYEFGEHGILPTTRTHSAAITCQVAG